MINLDVSAALIICDRVKFRFAEDIIARLVAVNQLHVNVGLPASVDRINDAEDWSDPCATCNQANVSSAALLLALFLENAVTQVRAPSHGPLTPNAITNRQGADEVAHLATLREFFCPCVTLDDKVGVALSVDGRDR